MSASTNSSISSLRPITTYVTGHADDGKAIVLDKRPAKWQNMDDDRMAFNVAYTTSQFPVEISADEDLKHHERVMAEGLALVNPNGTVCRVVDFEPGYECIMHRTQSLDYGIVIEGEVDLIMDSGEVQKMGRGDIAVQRATMHAWKNTSKGWARMMFVLQECKELKIGGNLLAPVGADLGKEKL